MKLQEMKPESVFKYFKTLTTIPRESGNEKAVSDYLVEFAKKNTLEVFQDKYYNVVINKPATKGYEKSKEVILQGHMDMVCVKKDDLKFDFEKDAIPIIVEDDMIKTKGTTLGADNGIAIAMAMAILENKELPHPPLTALFTVSEETGMQGVLNLETEKITGDILINMDSEDEGVFLTSCAGALRNKISIPIVFKVLPTNYETYEVIINGLLGGHSGMEINKNRASSIKLLARLLYQLEISIGIDVIDINGGEKLNAIPKQATAVISIKKNNIEKLHHLTNQYQEIFTNEYQSSDPNIKITINKIENKNQAVSDSTKTKLISLLNLLPVGVQSMSSNIEGLVESSNNIGLLEIKDQKIIIGNAIRSSVKSLKYEIYNRMRIISQLVDAKIEITSNYPEWEYQKDSPIRELMLQVYKKMYHQDAQVKAIHAGLECGFLKEKLGSIDMISIGPDIYDVHTPYERLSIASTRRVYEFICEVLKNLK